MYVRSPYTDFNPRSHEGSDQRGIDIPFSPPYFNPRSHEGSDQDNANDTSITTWISIHAPTRGATHSNGVALSHIPISIHAPTRGATFRSSSQALPAFYFNPRSHEGSDFSVFFSSSSGFLFQSTLPRGERLCADNLLVVLPAISIHAPTRGATPVASYTEQSVRNFNPRSHQGSDVTSSSNSSTVV